MMLPMQPDRYWESLIALRRQRLSTACAGPGQTGADGGLVDRALSDGQAKSSGQQATVSKGKGPGLSHVVAAQCDIHQGGL